MAINARGGSSEEIRRDSDRDHSRCDMSTVRSLYSAAKPYTAATLVTTCIERPVSKSAFPTNYRFRPCLKQNAIQFSAYILFTTCV